MMTKPSVLRKSSRGRFKPRESDPIVHILQHAIEQSGKSATQIAADALCSYQTVQKIIDGSTRRPHNYTRDNILNACGVEQRFYYNGKLWFTSTPNSLGARHVQNNH